MRHKLIALSALLIISFSLNAMQCKVARQPARVEPAMLTALKSCFPNYRIHTRNNETNRYERHTWTSECVPILKIKFSAEQIGMLINAMEEATYVVVRSAPTATEPAKLQYSGLLVPKTDYIVIMSTFVAADKQTP